MIKRALFIGAILAGVSGAAVFYGLGDLDGKNTTLDVPAVDVPAVDVNVTPEKTVDVAANAEPSGDYQKKTLDEVLNNAASAAKGDSNTHADDEAEDLGPRNGEEFIDEFEAQIRSEITAEAAPELANENTGNSASETVAAMLKPRASGNYVVDGETKTITSEDVLEVEVFEPGLEVEIFDSAQYSPSFETVQTPESFDSVQNSQSFESVQNSQSFEPVQEMATHSATPRGTITETELNNINARLTEAHNAADVTARDAIYLEIFDNALLSGSVELAEGISQQITSPELRQLTAEKLANSYK